MKNIYLLLFSVVFLSVLSCKQPKETKEENQETIDVKTAEDVDAIFPKGQQGSSDLFTGTAYNYGLVPMDSTYTTLVGNVYFEPKARSNWHSHPAGQILIITDGEGFHQIEGEPKQALKKGDVVKCPPNVKHWHGASPEKGMQQIYILPNTENGVVEWMEPVTDEQYTSN